MNARPRCAAHYVFMPIIAYTRETPGRLTLQERGQNDEMDLPSLAHSGTVVNNELETLVSTEQAHSRSNCDVRQRLRLTYLPLCLCCLSIREVDCRRSLYGRKDERCWWWRGCWMGSARESDVASFAQAPLNARINLHDRLSKKQDLRRTP
ncbi:hypothetical protein G7K_4663-t1 [Saitoella complicata NRRL Y-17804]|uniref:Uncharacterized protein n=1 Tax=Saitoella complicata (strain BCRC 22490 / CBS 7301 / JCM 7358 / NBRC 10748 / NRRL Y-17804) TaxID=698492 RepID=A0A0E9NL16_SAICN|nr:hypothetical protein G7K_4663-t1 [Saitoella complicata NRRL Y-17804]